MKKDETNGIEEKIKKSLESIRPSLQADGGDIEFVNFDEKKGVVKVSLVGMCAHCPMSQYTLKEGVEAILKKEVPEVKSVINN
jgi:Fe-S cluster biogenesis protein NfuA